MISITSCVRFSSNVVSSPWLRITTSTFFAAQMAKTSTAPKAQQPVLMGDHRPPDAAFQDIVQQAFQALSRVLTASLECHRHRECRLLALLGL